jgi:2-oxoglutarate ferredoxin oxidoreductase subunit gamma
MMINVIFSGLGGQGVLMMGYSLAHAAMGAGYHVTYLPSYEAEMQGATADCTVSISDKEIASPVASDAKYVVAMSNKAVLAFQTIITPGGSMFLNSSSIDIRPSRDNIAIYEIPAGEIAGRIGDPRAANIVMMGALIKKIGLIPPEIYRKSLKSIMESKKKSINDSNRKAFDAGYDYLNS